MGSNPILSALKEPGGVSVRLKLPGSFCMYGIPWNRAGAPPVEID